jgi:hypothetical protein
MGNHTEGNGRNGNGRNVALPDENRPSWRPQDEQHRSRRALSEEDDRYEDDRFGRHWEDRSARDWDRDRSERYGMGQSGYTSGRYEGDRSLGFESRNQGYPGSFEDRNRSMAGGHDRGTDDRFGGRGGSAYYERGERVHNPERHGAQGGYGGGRGWEPERIGGPRGYGYNDGDRPNLGTGGGMHGGSVSGTYPTRESWSPREGSTGYAGGGGHRGKGPASYQRSDERVREMICEALTDDDRIDASNIEVSVKNGEVTLAGNVEDRQMKRAAEDCVENVAGVKDVQNQIRVGTDKQRSSESERSRHRSS